MSDYEIKGKTTKISATSRCSLKIKDNYYTIEASEERSFNANEGDFIDFDKEWKDLFDSVNGVVDDQAEDIVQEYASNKNKW